MAASSANRALISVLRRALHYLYDPIELRQNPLLDGLNLRQQGDPVITLRQLLVGAIEALKPMGTVPSRSGPWRTYHLLSRRYVEQLTQQEVASDLALSIRQLQRDEHKALCVLADYLCQHYDLQLEAAAPRRALAFASETDIAPVKMNSQRVSGPEQELEWLRQSMPCEPADAGELIRETLKRAASLADSLQVRLECSIPEGLPSLAIQRVAAQQAMLIVVSLAVQSVPQGWVRLSARIDGWQERLEVRAIRHRQAAREPDKQLVAEARGAMIEAHLQMAQRLVALSEGTLESILDGAGDTPFIANFLLPAVAQVPVLVLDDNADTLRLLERYLTGSRYRFVGVRAPQELFDTVKGALPRIIILDVMLPQVDGWELLGRLRAHPQTCHIPVIVCTILPQEQLAISLGAAGFLSKPVSQEDLLAALDHLIAPQSPARR